MDSSPTIIATLVNDDGSTYRVLQVPSSTHVIREPIPASEPRVSDDGRFELNFQIQDWEPLVVVELAVMDDVCQYALPQYVGLWLRST